LALSSGGGSSESPAELLARASRLEKENGELRRQLDARTQQLLTLKAAAAEAQRSVEAANLERTRKDREINQMRGELEALRAARNNQHAQLPPLGGSSSNSSSNTASAAITVGGTNPPTQKASSADAEEDAASAKL